jgi:hypothetical protein
VPRDHWLESWEQQAILDFHGRYPLEGYRRLAFMMLDDDVAAVSPSSAYRVLKRAGRLDRHAWASSKKGTGFVQPPALHQHWHVDVSYINVGGTFYFLCSVLDGYSRYIVHWELRESMKEPETETIVQRALEKFPELRLFLRVAATHWLSETPRDPSRRFRFGRIPGDIFGIQKRPIAVSRFIAMTIYIATRLRARNRTFSGQCRSSCEVIPCEQVNSEATYAL